MKLSRWINSACVLAMALGFAGASCTTKQNTVLSKDGLLPPPLTKLTDRYFNY
jgi:hypothetical protein